MTSAVGTSIFGVLDEFDWTYQPGRFADPEIAADLVDAVAVHYSHWRPPERGQDEIRLMTDLRPYRGWALQAAETAVLSDGTIDRADIAYAGDGHILTMMRRAMSGLMLYGDRVVDVDPLSFEPYMGGGHEHRVPEILRGLARIGPLVDAGLIVLAPLQDQSIELSRDEESRFLEWMRAHFPDHPKASSRSGLWYFWDALRTAKASAATLVPLHDWEWYYLAFLVGDRSSTESEVLRVVTALAQIDLPMFVGIDTRTWMKVHDGEDAFHDWRAALRQASQTIQIEAVETDFVTVAQAVFEDLLLPQVRSLNRSVSRSKALTEALKEAPLRVTLGALFGAAGGAAVGRPLTGAAVSSAVSATSNVAHAVIRRPKPAGAQAILSLLNSRRP